MKAAFLMLACSLAATGETVTLAPTKDSDIYSYTDRATGTTGTLGINSSGVGSPHSQRTLIQFDLAGLAIPAAEIGSAKLRLFVVPPDPSFGALTPGNVEILRQTAAWTSPDHPDPVAVPGAARQSRHPVMFAGRPSPTLTDSPKNMRSRAHRVRAARPRATREGGSRACVHPCRMKA